MSSDGTSGSHEGSVFGPYRTIREIGHGAHGRVFLAKGPGRFVALKVCPKPDEPERVVDWERERRGWQLFSRIPQHPGLIRVWRMGETVDGAFWVAMELADAESDSDGMQFGAYQPRTLASVASAEIALPLCQCIDIGIRLASALEHLQRHHLIHRDVKPGNVLYVRGEPVLADAGLVNDVRDAASLVGTPGYVPPEKHYTPQGDVFSLGKTLYSISTGRRPEEEGLPPCTEADTDAPFFWKWMTILSRATARDPARRYRSAKGFLRDLQRLRLLTSIRPRTVRRALAVAAIVLVALPAIWRINIFKWWLGQPYEVKENVVLSYPYSLVKPFFMRSWKDAREAIRDIWDGDRWANVDDSNEAEDDEDLD